MTHEAGVLRIGLTFNLIHRRCNLHANKFLHRFELAFTEDDLQAKAVIDTEIEPLLPFRDALVVLNRDLAGEASLKTYEGDLTLKAEVNKRGAVFWAGTIGFGFSGGGCGAQLKFWIEHDQTSLPLMLEELNAIIEDAKNEER